MLIEQERDDSIIYSSASQDDFENIVHTAYILYKQPYNRLERVVKGKHSMELHLITHDSNRSNTLVIAEYNKQDQELIVYF
jgi:hypothetical protein